MAVRAKMRCTERKEQHWSQSDKRHPDQPAIDAVWVKLQPVYSDDPASPNYSWSKASPSASCP